MTTLNTTDLSQSTRVKISDMVKAANLLAELPWPDGARVEDLANTGTYMDRFNDGKFQVTYEGRSWILERVTLTTYPVVWNVTVESETGDVFVAPKLAATQDGGTAASRILTASVPRRKIGCLGPLAPLFPPKVTQVPIAGSLDLAREFGLTTTYAPTEIVRKARETIASLVLAERLG